jgi:hypothetical protein
MKNLFNGAIIMLTVCCTACNSKSSTGSNENSDTTKTVAATPTKFPYTKTKNRDWEINKDETNTLTALNALKAIENKDYQAISNSTADSIKSEIDGLRFKGTKAQMMEENKKFFATLKNIKIVPHDWESVIDKNKSEEWVSVWYTQYWEDMKGKRDSLNVFNDIGFKDGKIIQWDEYIQHFPKP